MSSGPSFKSGLTPKKLADYDTPSNPKQTEAEKSVAGLPYFAFVEELEQGRAFGKTKIQEFNRSDYLNIELRKQIANELFGTCNDVCVEQPFKCDLGTNIHFGERCYLNLNCYLLDVCSIRVGANTLFGPNVQVYTAIHPIDPIARRSTEYGKPIKIGKDCWIG
jgi:maltose O-acetyltransferase